MAEDKTKLEDINTEEIEEEEDFITLEFDDDTAVDCFILGVFEVSGKEYIALAPDDGTDDVYIYGYKENSADTFELLDINDEKEFNNAVAEFNKLIGEEDAEEDSDKTDKN